MYYRFAFHTHMPQLVLNNEMWGSGLKGDGLILIVSSPASISLPSSVQNNKNENYLLSTALTGLFYFFNTLFWEVVRWYSDVAREMISFFIFFKIAGRQVHLPVLCSTETRSPLSNLLHMHSKFCLFRHRWFFVALSIKHKHLISFPKCDGCLDQGCPLQQWSCCSRRVTVYVHVRACLSFGWICTINQRSNLSGKEISQDG